MSEQTEPLNISTIDGTLDVRGNLYAVNAKVTGTANVRRLNVDTLDAANILHPNKGTFESLALLREAYPEPRWGWTAYIGSATYGVGWNAGQTALEWHRLTGTGAPEDDPTVATLVERVSALEVQAARHALQSDVDALSAHIDTDDNLSDLRADIDNEAYTRKRCDVQSLGLNAGNNDLLLSIAHTSGGKSVAIPAASQTSAGVMTKTDKRNLDAATDFIDAAGSWDFPEIIEAITTLQTAVQRLGNQGLTACVPMRTFDMVYPLQQSVGTWHDGSIDSMPVLSRSKVVLVGHAFVLCGILGGAVATASLGDDVVVGGGDDPGSKEETEYNEWATYHYYRLWPKAGLYMDTDTREPLRNQLYLCDDTQVLYKATTGGIISEL